MLITDIQKQKKAKRYNIYLDNQFALGIYEDTLLKFGLRKNDDINERTISALKEYDEFHAGKNIALRFLNTRLRSEKEIRTKLKVKKISPGTIDKIVNHLKDIKYINDEYFAKIFTESKSGKKPIGKRKIKMQLFEKGISKEIVDKVISTEYDKETERNKILELTGKYEKKIRANNPLEKKNKCIRYLLSRGFDYDLVIEIIDEYFKKD